jgi:hypothetical protein
MPIAFCWFKNASFIASAPNELMKLVWNWIQMLRNQ